VRSALLFIACALSLSVLVVMLTLGICGLFQRRRRRRAPLIGQAREQLLRLLADPSADPDGVEGSRPAVELHGLSVAEVRALVIETGSSLGGGSTVRLRRVAESAGVLRRARRDLGSRRWHRRLRAGRVLSLLDDATGATEMLLRDAHPAVRALAAGWIGATRPSAAHALLDLVGDPDGLVRFAAQDALIRVGHGIGPLVAARLASGDDLVVEGLLEIAAHIPEPLPSDVVVGLVDHPSAEVRARSARVLAGMPGTQGRAALERLLDDVDPKVRQAAAAALADPSRWATGPLLAALLDDPEPAVRNQAGVTLLELGAPGVLLLRDVARTDGGRARQVASRALDFYDRDLDVVTS